VVTLDSATLMIWLWHAVQAVLGGAAGFAFYKFVGCRTGTCAITSNPWISTIYGAVLAVLMFSR